MLWKIQKYQKVIEMVSPKNLLSIYNNIYKSLNEKKNFNKKNSLTKTIQHYCISMKLKFVSKNNLSYYFHQ